MQNEIVIKISEGAAVKVEITEDGVVSHKNVTPDTLIECIRSSLKSDIVKSGILPPGTISVTIDPQKEENYVVMDFLEDRADMTYMETLYEKFPIPRYIFGFVVNKSGRISKVNLGVPADEKLTPDTKMYRYPFSNVSQFTMCTGMNELPKIKELSQLANLPYYILGLPENDDHFSADNNKLKMSRRDLMEHLRDKDRRYYYKHILMPMHYTTFTNFI